MHRRFPAPFLSGVITMLALAGSGLPAVSQAITPQAPAAPPVAAVSAEAPKVVKTEVERKGRSGLEIFIGTYLTLSKECKVGANPRLEVATQPKGGKVHTRPNAINLRAVPGAPKGNCIGTSPNGLGIFYRSERKFKGEDAFTIRLVYPSGDVREVHAKMIVE
ncbi:MAG: hypothetical protein LCH38_13235 [Proteobacteria bacterium]|nr:hypothetical protein [Pseudomonadota bacterium]